MAGAMVSDAGVISVQVDTAAAFVRAFDALAVNHSSRRAGFSVSEFTASHEDRVMTLLQRPVTRDDPGQTLKKT